MDYILDYYKMELFTDDDMRSFIQLNWITQEQYNSVKAA